jgi:hypothetical protein
MTISVVQEQQTSSNSSASNIGLSITVSGGDYLHVIVTNDSGSGNSIEVSSLVDGTNSYTSLDDINDGTDHQRIRHYWTGPVIGGTYTLTATFSATCVARGLLVAEIGGTSGLIAHNANVQASPGTGSNAVTSGTLTYTGVPALIYSLVASTADTTSNTTGTGFTNLGFKWTVIQGSQGAQTEYLITAVNSVTAATYTASVNSTRMTVAGVWQQATIVQSVRRIKRFFIPVYYPS